MDSNFINETKGYQCIPNALIFDSSLSDRARFVYVYMAAKPEGWNFYQGPMAAELGYSRETLSKYVNELISAGWLVKEGQTNDGRFGACNYRLKATADRTQAETSENAENGHGKADADTQDAETVPNFTDTEKFRNGKIPMRKNSGTYTIQTIDTKQISKQDREESLTHARAGEVTPETGSPVSTGEDTTPLKTETPTGAEKRESCAKEKKAAKPGLDYGFIPQDSHRLMMQEFVKYRKELGKPIKTQRGLSDRYKDLLKFGDGDETRMRSVLEQTMSNEWQGFYALKDEQPRRQSTAPAKKEGLFEHNMAEAQRAGIDANNPYRI